MTTNAIALAKASLIAPFVRPDPTSVPRDEVNALHGFLDEALHHCSPKNIQRCREWLCQNATTPTRFSAVGKYLTVLSNSFVDDGLEKKQSGITSAKRKRLHVLYVLNDWLHHAYHHNTGAGEAEDLSAIIETQVMELFELAASFDLDLHTKLHARITQLLEIWSQQAYFKPYFLSKLKETVLKASLGQHPKNSNGVNNAPVVEESIPFVMPKQHGDSSTPWYDLPAATLLPHMTPNSSQPINSQRITPLQFQGGPAESTLTALVQDFMKDADVIYGDEEILDEGISLDYDELGQKLYKNRDGEDFTFGDTYYGWSKAFCLKMRRRLKDNTGQKETGRQRDSFDNSKGYSQQSDSSSSRDRSRSRARQWSRSLSRSTRSLSRSRTRSESRGQARRFRDGRRSRSPYRRLQSRSQSRSNHYQERSSYRSRSHSRNRERSYSPPEPSRQTTSLQFSRQGYLIPPPPPPVAQFPLAMPPNQINMALPGVSLGNSGLPLIPPKPMGWQGPWPPPPPPPPPHMNSHIIMPPFTPSFGQGPPPPPPPPSQHFQSTDANWHHKDMRRR